MKSWLIYAVLPTVAASTLLTMAISGEAAEIAAAGWVLEADPRSRQVWDTETSGPDGGGAAPSYEALLEPMILEIRTIPPLQGVRFALDGRRFESDEQGVTTIRVWRGGTHQLEALPLESNTSDRRLEFARWGDPVFTPQRLIVISEFTSLEAGFDVHLPVKLRFVDLSGEPVPAGRISEVVLKNSIGDVYTFPGEAVEWLQAGHVVGRDFTLEQVAIVYSVQRVAVDGSNVVNRGQQRFMAEPEGRPDIELLLYSVQLAGRDALFGFPIGSGVRLQFPDGRQEYASFEGKAMLHLESLARGTYRATVVGAVGLAPPSIFVLSRDQEVSAVMISALDVLVVLLIGSSILLGLVLIGRPELRERFRNRLYPGKARAVSSPVDAGGEADLRA